MSDIMSYVTLRTSEGNERDPKTIYAEVTLNGVDITSPKLFSVRLGIGRDAETIQVSRDILRTFCNDFLRIDQKMDGMHLLLRKTHLEIKNL